MSTSLSYTLVARFVVGATLGAALCGTSIAAPATKPEDAVTRFLVEKGLVGTAATTPNSADSAASNTADLSIEPTAAQPLVERLRDRASEMVLTAFEFLGVRYRSGGSSAEHGFDCSGFTRHVFEMSIGLVLPRRADEQATSPGLFSVRRDELKPGDLVFFNTLRRTFSHVGIYVGSGRFIHSPRTGGEVRVEDMGTSYWARRYTGARRADLAARPELPATSTSGAVKATAVGIRNVY
jgi:cell wall-associated NlpC family hydrolase